MARHKPEQRLAEIEALVRRHPRGLSTGDIAAELQPQVSRRTLQHWLQQLVSSGRLSRERDGRWPTFRLPPAADVDGESASIPVSPDGAKVRAYVRQPLHRRKPVGYQRTFLDRYRPNVSAYLTEAERAHLREVGRVSHADQVAGTYARRILGRLLIDLSWNSSRLEGNTYSLLDTNLLIESGQAAEGRASLETQMILNHKEAIEFLVGAAEEIGFNRYTILNLHATLANNLLPDPSAPGRLRSFAVGIEGSVFHPLEVPQLVEECFEQVLATASAIGDPFEQALFVMVQLPYLQPFDDVNKRVSRLAANIPFIRSNLSPLSFTDVPRADYTEAVLCVYELARVELMRDVFIWAYERSAARYAAIRQSLGEPDPFRLRHRGEIRQVVGDVIRAGLDKRAAAAHVASWSREHMPTDEVDRFREVVEGELLGLHEGNFARYQVRPSEFEAWRRAWTEGANPRDPGGRS